MVNFTSLDYKFTVQLNNEVVAVAIANLANVAPTTTESGLSIVVPPSTTVKVTGINAESAQTKGWTASLTGKVSI